MYLRLPAYITGSHRDLRAADISNQIVIDAYTVHKQLIVETQLLVKRQLLPAMPAQTGPLAAELPALVARKRAEAAALYPAAARVPSSPSPAAATLLSLRLRRRRAR